MLSRQRNEIFGINGNMFFFDYQKNRSRVFQMKFQLQEVYKFLSQAMKDSEQNDHKITLAQGLMFHSIQRDYETIYQNFSLLSYLTRQCNVKIIDRLKKTQKEVEYEVDEFTANRRTLYLWEKFKQSFAINGELGIIYEITESLDVSEGITVKAQFRPQIIKNREYISITIVDEENWFASNLKFKQNAAENRLTEHRSLKENELEYLYQEPERIRTKEIKGKHFSIAFQGGGAKGVSYIGVYETLRAQMQKDKSKIRSVIGSSAGGILGLAVCCGLSKEEIIEVGVRDLSKITSKDRTYRGDYQDKEKEIMKELKQFLLYYNILKPDVFDLLEKRLEDQEVHEALLELIQAFNPSIAELFRFEKEGKPYASFYGLFMASLMTGTALREIAMKFLEKFKEKYNPKHDQKISQEDWGATVSFKEFYEVTGIEFTCTSVDLKNHTLRFFNHKTTPKMPVCYAVQMTGSFPVAFESQKWQKEWGKYYIHYENTRKEIDLEGVNFTDGGMLANFPVKYLDNEKMRPMYFAHPKINGGDNETILYGFGLNSLTEKTPEKKAKFQAAWKKFKEKIDVTRFEKLGIFFRTGGSVASEKFKGIGSGISQAASSVYRFFSGRKEEEQEDQRRAYKDITADVPVIGFGLNLLETYRKSKDQLTFECFENQIFNLKTRAKFEGTYDPNELRKELTVLLDRFETLIAPKTDIDPVDGVIANLDQLHREMEGAALTEHNLLDFENRLNWFCSNYCYYSAQTAKKTFIQGLIQIEGIRKSTVFRNCSILKDFHVLKKFLKEVKQYFEAARKDQSQESKLMMEALTKIQKKENQNVKEVRGHFNNYIENEIGKDKYNSLGKQFIENFCWYMHQSMIIPMESIQEFKASIMQSCLHEIKTGIEAYDNRQSITEYILRKFAEHPEQKQKSIHVVLQSASHAQKYCHKYYEQIQEAINAYNTIEDKEYRIGTITSSNYYSLASFLHASDFPAEKVEKEIWSLQDLIDINPEIDKNFEEDSDDDLDYYWCKSKTTKMKALEKYAWEHREKTFAVLKNYLNSDKHQNLTPQLLKEKSKEYPKALREKIKSENDTLDEAIQRSLNYVLDEMSKAAEEVEEENLDAASYAKRLSKALSLRLENKDVNFAQENRKINKDMLKFMNDLKNHFQGIAQYILMKTPNATEACEMHKNKFKNKEVFRGLIICEMLTSSRVKTYVSKKLEEMNLSRDITLKEFYDSTEKHIQLNFVVVESPANIVRIINYKTRPQMPLWAAITASCSVPFLFEKFLDRKEWKYAPNYDPKKRKARKAENYFADPQPDATFLQSADLLVKMPLELLTNQKLREQITNEQNELFLGFTFTPLDKKPLTLQKEKYKKTKPYDLWDLDSLCKNFHSDLLTLPVFEQRKSALEKYLNSHDNLIRAIYDKQTTILPIRIDTLDFDKIAQNGTQLTHLCQDSIEQAKYVTAQKLMNDSHNFKYFYITAEKGYKLKDRISIRFLSFFETCRDFSEKWKIFYKFSQEKDYNELKDEYLTIPSGKEELFIQVFFTGEEEIAILSHRLDLKNLKRDAFSFTYKLPYNKLNYQLLLHPLNSKLKKQDADRSIEVRSYINKDRTGNSFDKPQSCSVCFQSLAKWERIKTDNQRKSQQTVIMMKCPNCPKIYSLKQKFRPELKKNGIYSPFGDEFEKSMDRHHQIEKVREISFKQCDYCGRIKSYEAYYYQRKSKIILCGCCLHKYSVKKV